MREGEVDQYDIKKDSYNECMYKVLIFIGAIEYLSQPPNNPDVHTALERVWL